MSPSLKLGKKPARPGAVKLKLSTYLDTSALPTPPDEFGHEGLVSDWLMLGNDTLGDCVIAGALHEHMLWNAEAGKPINVNDACAVRNYSAITGYNPAIPSSDQGTDITVAAEYRRTTGLVDADGIVHKIGAYVALDPGDLTQLWYALYLFDGVGIGVELPSQWMDAFNAGRPWDAVTRPSIEGGHYISGAAKRAGNATVISWGRGVQLTPAGYQQFNDETLAYLSEEKLVNGKSLEGFDLDQLRADLDALGDQPPAPGPVPGPPVPITPCSTLKAIRRKFRK